MSNTRFLVSCLAHVLLLVSALCGPAQAQYQKLYTADTALRSPLTLTPLPDGNLVQSGLYGSFNAQGLPQLRAFYVHKTDPQGTTLWARTYTTDSLFTTISAVHPLPDGNLILFGGYAQHVLLVKMDTDGHVLWKKAYPSLRYQEPDGIFSTNPTRDGFTLLPDGGFAAVTTRPPTLDGGGLNLTRFDAQGHLMWTRTYQVGTDQFANTVCLHNQQEGGFIVVGFSNTQNCYALNVIKTTAQGDTLWTRQYQNDCNKVLWGIGAWQAPNGRINVLAQTYANAGSPAELIALALESGTGAVHHAARLTPADTATTFVSINFSQLGIGAGGSAIIPQTVSTPTGLHGVLIHLDGDLELIGTTRYANRLNPAVTYAFAAAFTPEEELPVVVGTTLAPGGGFATWVVTPQADGTTTEPSEYFATLPLNRQAIALAATSQCTVLAPTPPALLTPPLTDTPLAIAEQTARLGKPIPTLIAVDDHRNAAPGDTVVLNVFDNDLYTGIDNLRFFQNPQLVGPANPGVTLTYTDNGLVTFITDSTFTGSVTYRYTPWDGAFAAQKQATITVFAAASYVNVEAKPGFVRLCPSQRLPELKLRGKKQSSDSLKLVLPSSVMINCQNCTVLTQGDFTVYTIFTQNNHFQLDISFDSVVSCASTIPYRAFIQSATGDTVSTAASELSIISSNVKLTLITPVALPLSEKDPKGIVGLFMDSCTSGTGVVSYTDSLTIENGTPDSTLVPVRFNFSSSLSLFHGQSQLDSDSVYWFWVQGSRTLPLTVQVPCGTNCTSTFTLTHRYQCPTCTSSTDKKEVDLNLTRRYGNPILSIHRLPARVPLFCQAGEVVYTYVVANADSARGPARIIGLTVTDTLPGAIIERPANDTYIYPGNSDTIRIRYPVPACTGFCDEQGLTFRAPETITLNYQRRCNNTSRSLIWNRPVNDPPVRVNRLVREVFWENQGNQVKGHVLPGDTLRVLARIRPSQPLGTTACFRIDTVIVPDFSLLAGIPGIVVAPDSAAVFLFRFTGNRCLDSLLAPHELPLSLPLVFRYGSCTAATDWLPPCTTQVSVTSKCGAPCSSLPNTAQQPPLMRRTTINGASTCCPDTAPATTPDLTRAYRGDRIQFGLEGQITRTISGDPSTSSQFQAWWDQLRRFFCVLQYNYENPVGSLNQPFRLFREEVRNGRFVFTWDTNTYTVQANCAAPAFQEPDIPGLAPPFTNFPNQWYVVEADTQQLDTLVQLTAQYSGVIGVRFEGEFTVAFNETLKPGVTNLDIRGEFMLMVPGPAVGRQQFPASFQSDSQLLVRSCDASYATRFTFLRPHAEPAFSRPTVPFDTTFTAVNTTAAQLCASRSVAIPFGPFEVAYAGATGGDDFPDETRPIVAWGNGLQVQVPTGAVYDPASAITYTRTVQGSVVTERPLVPEVQGTTLHFACQDTGGLCTGPSVLDVVGNGSDGPVDERVRIGGVLRLSLPASCGVNDTTRITALLPTSLNPYLGAASTGSGSCTSPDLPITQTDSIPLAKVISSSPFDFTLENANYFLVEGSPVIQVPVAMQPILTGIRPIVRVTVINGTDTLNGTNDTISDTTSPIRFVNGQSPTNPSLKDITDTLGCNGNAAACPTWTQLPFTSSASLFRIQFAANPCDSVEVRVTISIPCLPDSACHTQTHTIFKSPVPDTAQLEIIKVTPGRLPSCPSARETLTVTTKQSTGYPGDGQNIHRILVRIPGSQADSISFPLADTTWEDGQFAYFVLTGAGSLDKGINNTYHFTSCVERTQFCVAGLNACGTPILPDSSAFTCTADNINPILAFNLSTGANLNSVCLSTNTLNSLQATVNISVPRPVRNPRLLLYLPQGLVPVGFIEDTAIPGRWTRPLAPPCTLSNASEHPVTLNPTCDFAFGQVTLQAALQYDHSGCQNYESSYRTSLLFTFAPALQEPGDSVLTVRVAPDTLYCAGYHRIRLTLSDSLDPQTDTLAYVGIRLPAGLWADLSATDYEAAAGTDSSRTDSFFVSLGGLATDTLSFPVRLFTDSTTASCELYTPVRAYYRQKQVIPCLNCTRFVGKDTGKMDSLWVCPIRITASPDTQICSNTSVALTATGATTYTWSPATGLTNATVANPTFNGTTTTTYTVTGTDANGCTGTATVTVNIRAIQLTATLVQGQCRQYALQLTPTGGGALKTGTTPSTAGIVWAPSSQISGGANLNQPSVTTQFIPSATLSRTYTVTVRYTDGCTLTQTITLAPLRARVVPQRDTICSGDTATLTAATVHPLPDTTFIQTGTPPFTYSWASASASVATTQALNVSPVSTTTYTVTVTDGTGCSATATGTVIFRVRPNLTLPSSYSVCANKTVTITAGPTGTGVTYAWVLSPGSPPASNRTFTFTPPNDTLTQPQTFTYTVTATNTSSGCTNAATTAVTVQPAPAQPMVSPVAICRGGFAVLAVSNPVTGATYQWAPSNRLQSTGGHTVSTTILNTAGTYTFSVTATLGACTASSTVQVTVGPAAEASASAPSICQGETVTLSATGGNQYDWTGPGNQSFSGNSVSVAPAATTTYTVTVTDNITCTATATVTVSVLAANLAAQTVQVCQNQSIQLPAAVSGPPGATYVWSPATHLNNPNSQSPTFGPVADTGTYTYTVTATAATGCTVSTTVSVLVQAQPVDVAFGVGRPACVADGVVLVPNPAGTYLVLPADGATTTPEGIVLTPPVTTAYSVYAAGSEACAPVFTYTAPPARTENSQLVCPACTTLAGLLNYRSNSPFNTQPAGSTIVDANTFRVQLGSNTGNTRLRYWRMNASFVLNTNETLTLDNVGILVNSPSNPNAAPLTITVRSGAVLTLRNHTVIRALGNRMWGGIVVEPGGSVVVDRSLIADAIIGIRQRNTLAGNAPGTVVLDSACLDRNYESVVVEGYTPGTPPAGTTTFVEAVPTRNLNNPFNPFSQQTHTVEAGPLRMTGTTIQCSLPLRQPHAGRRGQVGVRLGRADEQPAAVRTCVIGTLDTLLPAAHRNTFRDQRCGVRIMPRTATGAVVVRHNDFRDGFPNPARFPAPDDLVGAPGSYGLDLGSFYQTSSAPAGAGRLFVVEHNTFGNQNPPYRNPYTGMEYSSGTATTAAQADATGNPYGGAAISIVHSDANVLAAGAPATLFGGLVQVRNNEFDGVWRGVQLIQGIGETNFMPSRTKTAIVNNTFTDTWQGVESIRFEPLFVGPGFVLNAPGLYTRIQDNTFDTLTRGIHLWGPHRQVIATTPNEVTPVDVPLVLRNRMTGFRDGPDDGNFGLGSVYQTFPLGIALTEATRTRVQDNTLVGIAPVRSANIQTTYANNPYLDQGILLEGSPSVALTCNRIGGFGNGLTAFGPCAGSVLRTNVLALNTRGLTLFNGGTLGPQGTQTDPHLNVWRIGTGQTGTFSRESFGFDTPIAADPQNAGLPADYLYDVPPNLNAQENPALCIVVGGIPQAALSSECPVEFVFAGKQNLPTTCNPVNVAWPLWPASYTLTNEERAIAALIDDTARVHPRFHAAIRYQERAEAYDRLKELPQPHPYAPFNQFRQAIDTATHHHIAQLDTIAQLAAQGETTAALTATRQLQPTNTVEHAWKDYYTLILSPGNRTANGFTATAIQQIVTLSERCPRQYGPAVYRARVLRFLVERKHRPYTDLCTETPEPQSQARTATSAPRPTEAGELTFNLYPNPTTGTTRLQAFTRQKLEPLTVTVSDLHGRALQTVDWVEPAQPIDLQTEGNPAGIYWIQIQHRNTTVGELKLVIIR
jgi:hypothetical protein